MSVQFQTLACTECPAGFECSDATSNPEYCEVGTYSSAGSTSCTDCPAGQSCLNPADSPVNCDDGYYSPLVRATDSRL